MKEKFIAIDLDGTLLKKPHFNFTEIDKKMVKKAQGQGYKVGIASGRAIVEAQELEKRESIKFDFIIGLNGMESTLSTEEYLLDKKIITVLIENGIEFEIQDGANRFFTDDFYEKIPVLLGTDAFLISTLDGAENLNAKKIVIRTVNNKLAISEISKIIKPYEEYDFFVVNDFSIEIVNKGVNKKTALNNIISNESYVMSIGDSYNDIELLSYSDNGYLMSSASEELKERYHNKFKQVNSVTDAIKLELLDTKGVVFDLDGVITDTANYHFYAWKDTVSDYGLTVTKEVNELLKGLSREDSLAVILDKNGVEMSEYQKDEILKLKNERYLSLISNMNESDLLEGIMLLLIKLKKSGLRMAIASASKNAPYILKSLNISHFFDVVVDVEKIKAGKPAPEIFHSAINQLNLKPHEVVAIEDSISGIQAINALDIVSIGIGSTLLESTITLDNTKDLFGLGWNGN